MEITPDKSWNALLEDLLKNPGAVLVMGTSDVGKSTLIKWLLKGLLQNGKKVCLVDADVGQTSLGLPGTISKKTFRKLKDMEKFTPEEMIFPGVLNPAKNFAGMIDGTKEMAEACANKEIPYTLIDTTGLVGGEVGKALKLAKVRAIKPRHVVAIEREEELHHILPHLKGVRVHSLKASPLVKSRSPVQRAAYREQKFAGYFKGSKVIKVPLKGVEFSYKGKEFDPEGNAIQYGGLLGLNREDRTLALGLYIGVERETLLVKTPFVEVEKINRIIIGDIVLV